MCHASCLFVAAPERLNRRPRRKFAGQLCPPRWERVYLQSDAPIWRYQKLSISLGLIFVISFGNSLSVWICIGDFLTFSIGFWLRPISRIQRKNAIAPKRIGSPEEAGYDTPGCRVTFSHDGLFVSVQSVRKTLLLNFNWEAPFSLAFVSLKWVINCHNNNININNNTPTTAAEAAQTAPSNCQRCYCWSALRIAIFHAGLRSSIKRPSSGFQISLQRYCAVARVWSVWGVLGPVLLAIRAIDGSMWPHDYR